MHVISPSCNAKPVTLSYVKSLCEYEIRYQRIAKNVQHPKSAIKNATITIRHRVSTYYYMWYRNEWCVKVTNWKQLTMVVIKSWIYRFECCGKLAKLIFLSPNLLMIRRHFCERNPLRSVQLTSILLSCSKSLTNVNRNSDSNRFVSNRFENWQIHW